MAAASDRNDDQPVGEHAPDAARRRLIGSGALVLSLGVPQIARGASLLGVRVWPAAEYTRVTLEHDVPLRFSHFALDNPARLVIDVDGIELTPKFKELVGKVEGDDPFIANVRLGQNRPRVVRLVVELKQEIRPQVFAAAPVGPYQHRLVIDLHPLVPRDPLLALLQEQGARSGPSRAAAAEPAQGTTAPAPGEIVLSALGGCLGVGITAVATCKQVKLSKLELYLEGDIGNPAAWGAGGAEMLPPQMGFQAIRVKVVLEGDASPFPDSQWSHLRREIAADGGEIAGLVRADCQRHTIVLRHSAR